MTESGQEEEIWQQTSPSGRDWLPVTISLRARAEPIRLQFIATRGGGDGVAMSIDDITLKFGEICNERTWFIFGMIIYFICPSVCLQGSVLVLRLAGVNALIRHAYLMNGFAMAIRIALQEKTNLTAVSALRHAYPVLAALEYQLS